MALRAVLLDMGGVLVPEPGGYASATREGQLLERLRELGVDDPVREIERRSEELVRAYRALEAECTQPDLDEVFSALDPQVYALLMDAFRRQATRPVYPGVRRIVEELAQDFLLGLVSNTVIPGDHHAANLQKGGILHHFEVAVWSANFGRRKLDPAMILHVLEKLDVPPADAVMVGDKIRSDVETARRAGVRSVWLRREDGELGGSAQPDHVIDDLAALPLLLKTAL